jgi:hypothetical protein
LRKARARSADIVFQQVPAPVRWHGAVPVRSSIEGAMKRKKGEDGDDFDVFGEEANDEFAAEELEGEDDELYGDDIDEEFDDDEDDFDEDFEDEESFEEEEEDFDGLVDDDE